MGSGGGNTVTRTLIPVLLTLLILGILFLLYFLKYIPGRQSAYNNQAFMELRQIAKAAQERDNGYVFAINTLLNAPQSSSPLFRSFKWSPRVPGIQDTPLDLRPSRLTSDSLNKGTSLLTYPLVSRVKRKDSVFLMSVRLDSLLAPNIVTYRDIFESYLLINRSTSGNSLGNVLFSSDNLPLANSFNTDTLLKKKDNTDPLYIHDVNIGGTPYKIFIYPLQIGSTPTLLAGLISVTRYNAGYKDIPLDLFVPAGIIILLLVICLPILKIFILGSGETIVDWNIRQLIGSYFIAAFTCCLLFSWLFMTWSQSASNKTNLEQLSRQIHHQFTSEIDTICLQLRKWDSAYTTIRDSSSLISALEGNKMPSPPDSTRLDAIFQPEVYPYSDYVFWVDSTGKWIATWSERFKGNKPSMLDAQNRDYFKDFVNGKYLTLHDSALYFTIQPLLSRLDGEYRINVLTKSTAVPTGASHHRPLLIGLSAKMHSVMNTVLPQGYNYSIIDKNGNVLYDSRPGRALLTNFLNESDVSSLLDQPLRYRTHRYFNHFQLKGRDMALDAIPMSRLPYTLVTYTELSDADHFQIHVIGLTALLTTLLVILLITSTVINEWTKKKPNILLAPTRHFKWLRPLPRKEGYYKYLIIGMFSLFTVDCLIWWVITVVFRQQEFSLFFINLSFPLYISLYYYSLRKKVNDHEKFGRISIPLVTFFVLLFALLLISSFYGDTTPGIPLLFVAAQIPLFATYRLFVRLYMAFRQPSDTSFSRFARSLAGEKLPTTNWLRHYSMAIITGVFMISIIPACSIFWLFFKQETELRHQSSRLGSALTINQRRTRINERMTDYKIKPADKLSRLRQLKFNDGIYLLWGDSIRRDPVKGGIPFFPVADQYNGLHDVFFPSDSNVLAEVSPSDWAMEAPWNFTRSADDDDPAVSLNYKYPSDRLNPEELQLKAGPEATWSSISLTNNTYISMGVFHYILFDLAEILVMFLFYKLTIALATRIFLIDMFHNGLHFSYKDGQLSTPPPCFEDSRDLNLQMAAIRAEERSAYGNPVTWGETILCNRTTYADVYEKKWEKLPPEKKFILYDLARDGFANYRTANIIFDLLRDRLVQFNPDGHLELATDSFREFVLQKTNDPGVIAILKKSQQKGEWLSFKTGLMILFTAFGLFIFFTQDALFQKMTGLLTTLVSITTQFSSFFEKTIPRSADDTPPAGKGDKDK